MKLAAQLRQEKVQTKVWTSRRGLRLGGLPFARGHLYYLLRNRLYIGEIRHRDLWYPGEHQGIVPRDVWAKVQARLNDNAQARRNDLKKRSTSLLTGLIRDGVGNRFMPSFTVKRGRRYHYYVSQPAVNNSGEPMSRPTRLPAHEVESRVTERLQTFLKSDAELFDALSISLEGPGVIQPLLTAAKKLAAKCTQVHVPESRQLLLVLLRSVVIYDDRIEILLGRTELCQTLSGIPNEHQWRDAKVSTTRFV